MQFTAAAPRPVLVADALFIIVIKLFSVPKISWLVNSRVLVYWFSVSTLALKWLSFVGLFWVI